MRPFLAPKRKLLELLALVALNLALYLVFWDFAVLILFSLGFIWNWSASQDLDALFTNRRYRFSTIKMTKNLQGLILRPFERAPAPVKLVLRVLPAGIFWSGVIYFLESQMPWWATFLGSLAFELMQLEIDFIKKHKDTQA
jgi:hypothetical protein